MAEDDARPSPDALLAAADQERRGRLKVFLGAAPGVGKTYAMLRAGHRRRADGVDVAVGLVETHGRVETEALVAGLELLPRKQIAYKGRHLGELDLDAALARRPALLLVDELAHSNVPGSRHPKRYMDVDELLDAGIDVYTTLNIQHIESLNDVVARITRIRVRETLPDSVLERADEVELVDLTPEELTRRLAEGKVYVPDQARRAARHYFQPGNLTALRELALRRTAERVDDQMVDYMRAHAIEGPWAAGERLLVCVSDDPGARALVRAARRLADLMNARWVAAYVEMPGHYRLSETARDRIAGALRLAEHLGGEAVTLPARDLPGELLRYAREHNITQIVIAKSRWSGLAAFFRRSLVGELLRRSDSVAVHVVPVASLAKRPRRRWALPRWQRAWARRYGASALAVGAAALVAQTIYNLVPLPNLSMIFLAAVLFSAVTRGVAAAVFASLLSFAVYNFVFVPPFYTFQVTDGHDLLALLTFLVVAILTGGLAGRVRDQAGDARARVKAMAALYDFSRKLAATTTLDDLLWAIAYQVASTYRARVVILLPERGELRLATGYPPEDELGPGEWTAARWAFQRGEPAGRGTDTLPAVDWLFLPLKTAAGMVGALGLNRAAELAALDPERARQLDALLDQASVAIARLRLDAEMAEARVAAATEKLRAALFSSISHDLRTPLASIIGAVTSLRGYGADYPESARRDLLATIQEEAERLNRFVGNLLDMTRLESGALELKRDWVEIGEVIGTALARVRPQLGHRRVELDLATDLPLLRLDFVLIEQVLVNLLDNAAKYAPDGSGVTVTARREVSDVVVEVSDEGPGIPEADLDRVFDKFFRVGAADRQIAGTGLGLSICRGLVEAHGGSIAVRSPVADGHGTAFMIHLPVEAQPALGDAAVQPAA